MSVDVAGAQADHVLQLRVGASPRDRIVIDDERGERVDMHAAMRHLVGSERGRLSMYLDPQTADDVVAQMSSAVPPGSQLVVDYAELSWFKGTDFERATDAISKDLRRGGEPLKAGLLDVHGTLDRCGFDVIDDEATEDLRSRYGLDPLTRHYPTRMVTTRSGT